MADWFSVYLSLGEAHSIKVEKILFKEKSDYQEVVVFEVWHLLVTFLNFTYKLEVINTYLFFLAVINIWEGSCTWWNCSVDWEGWMCLPGDDSSSSPLFNSVPQNCKVFCLNEHCIRPQFIPCLFVEHNNKYHWFQFEKFIYLYHIKKGKIAAVNCVPHLIFSSLEVASSC